MILIYLEVVDYDKNSHDYSDSQEADQGDQGALTIGTLDVDLKALAVLYVAEEGGDAERNPPRHVLHVHPEADPGHDDDEDGGDV